MTKLPLTFVPPVIAHRGANSVAPENTLAAFLKAKDSGAKWVEFDVMLAECGEAVVIHDETLDRTTNGSGKVCDYPYSYLQSLDAGSWFDKKFSGERIPTLTQVIGLLKSLQLSANVEIKAVRGQEERTVTKVLKDIKQFWTADMTPPLFSSFSLPILRNLRLQEPTAIIGVLVDEWFPGWQAACMELNCFSVNINEKIITYDVVQPIQSMQKAILSYTVNELDRARQLLSWGVTAVFTDKFAEMAAAFNK